MITGSVVSSLQGEPRATHDIDVVVAIRGPAAAVAAGLKAARWKRGAVRRRPARVRGAARLDEAYLEQWAATLGVAAALGRLRAEAQPIE